MIMRLKIIILLLFFTQWSFAQTTVQFAEPHQFFDPSEKVLHIKIQINNIKAYASGNPILLEVFSDLEDDVPLGITKTQHIDKVIWPEDYANGAELQLPVKASALEGIEKFTLFLRKKGENERFIISQHSHIVVLNRNIVHQSHIGIAVPRGNGQTGGTATRETITIPFRLITRGDMPVETDEVVVQVGVKGLKEHDSLAAFRLTGAISNHVFRVEKQQGPETYQHLIALLNAGQQPELEISGITHQSQHQIAIAPLAQSARFPLKKTGWTDASYSFYLGTNFEFATTFEAKDIYYQVDISLFNLLKSRWGLRAGMYKNNTSRYLEDFMLRPNRYELVGETAEGSIYNLIQTGMAPVVTTESLGFYFELPYKLIDSERFTLFLAPHLELIERRETYSYEVAYESVLKTDITNYNIDFLSTRPLPKEKLSKYWESYLGLAFPMRYRDPGERFEVTLNPVFGAGYPGPYPIFTTLLYLGPDYDYIQIFETNSNPLFFGAFGFNIVINPKEAFGIKLGADVRKYFGEARKPVVSINLSTKLEFSKLFDLARG